MNERSNELQIIHLNDLQRPNEIQMTSVTWLTKLKTTLIDRFCALKITTSFTGLNHLVLDFSYFFLLIEQLSNFDQSIVMFAGLFVFFLLIR